MDKAAAPPDLSTMAPCGSVAGTPRWVCPRNYWVPCLGHFFATSINRERDGASTLGGRRFIFRRNNQSIVGLSGCYNKRAEARPGGSMWGAKVPSFWPSNWATWKWWNKICPGLRQLLINVFHTTTNQKHAGTMEEVKERRFNWRGMQGGARYHSFGSNKG